ncbi:MAG: alpha/beta hydrolase fold domain-containing protein [Bryobacteraceae bacterium]|nr:alpha/beta hydrolase fold domain-containing protein [Bryobacteraceae bacterium]
MMRLALLAIAAVGLLNGQESHIFKTAPQGELRIHVFKPEGGGPRRPAALFFFGGGFRSGTPQQFFPFAKHLASRGIVAASAEYRVSSRHQTTPRESAEDCRDAMRWLLENAASLGVDARRVAWGGGSAGGGCALAGALNGGPRPQAWLLFNPVTDMRKYDLPELSAVTLAGRGEAPALILVGTEDKTWLPLIREYAARNWELGNRVDLWLAPGMPHGFFNREPWLTASMEAMDRFLVSLGWLRGASGLPAGEARLERAARVPANTTLRPALEYAPGRHLDLYLPANPGRRPELVVFVHGGAWRQGSRANPPAFELLDAGYAVASVSYRLSQVAKFPAQIEDVRAAVKWLRTHAKEHGYNAARIAAWGPSAGGHLVALLGTSGNDVQAVVDYFGPSDLLRIGDFPSDIDHNAPDSPESQLIGAPIQQRPDLAAKANPIAYITKNAPPFLIVHGDQDRVVPFNQSELLHEALLQAGVESHFIAMRGAGHGGPAFFSPFIMGRILDFLDRHVRR